MRLAKPLIIISLLALLTACSSDKSKPAQTTASNNFQPVPSAPQKPDLKRASAINVQLGMGYLQQGDMARAKQKLLLALKQQPNSGPALSAMGYYLAATGQHQQADSYFNKSIKADSKDGKMYNNYGTFLCDNGRYQAADKEFMKAVKEPTYIYTAEAYENAGLCALEVPDYGKAEQYFMQALQHDPRRATSMLELAEINYRDKQYVRASAYLRSFAQRSKQTPQSLLLGIKIGQQLGNKNQVASDALALRNQYPNSQQYQTYLTSVKNHD